MNPYIYLSILGYLIVSELIITQAKDTQSLNTRYPRRKTLEYSDHQQLNHRNLKKSKDSSIVDGKTAVTGI